MRDNTTPGPLDRLAELMRSGRMAPILASWDIPALYRELKAAGFAQRDIAARTGQSQSEIWEITKGRYPRDHRVLRRICEGLQVPPERMGLSWHGPDGRCYRPDTAYRGGNAAAGEGDEEMLRRHFEKLLGVGAAAAFGAPVVGVGGIGEIADLAPPPLAAEVPTRIGMTDVTVILRSHREHLANLSRMVGGQAGSAVRLAEWAERWLSADCADTVRTALLSELAHLNVITGWCCHDSGEPARAHYHFGRAIEHATDAGDAYRGAYALRYAGSMLLEGGQPDDGLKALQLADVRLHAARRDDPRVAPLGAQIHAASAHALSQLDEPRPVQVRAELARARDKWEPPTPHDQARMDNVTGRALLHLGQFDAAQAAAGLAVRTYRELGYRRAGVVAELTVAQAHVQTRDPRGLPLARKAIEDVRGTRSVGARRTFLPPLADALEAWPSSDARELAREARRVAA